MVCDIMILMCRLVFLVWLWMMVILLFKFNLLSVLVRKFEWCSIGLMRVILRLGCRIVKGIFGNLVLFLMLVMW